MEYGVIHSDLTDEEIKPTDLLKAYLNLVARDNKTFFAETDRLPADCPACGSQEISSDFVKSGFRYVTCKACATIHTNPTPKQASIERFFRESDARKFWLREIWPTTAKQRQKKIIGPTLDWIQTFLDESFGEKPTSIAEVYPNNWGLLSGWNAGKNFASLTVVEALYSQSPERPTASSSLQTNERFDGVLLIDSLGRVENPAQVLRWSAEHLKKNGLCFVTCILSSGFDIMTLGQHSNLLAPPDHLTIFSFEGLEQLLKTLPFEVVEFSTPGVLDLQNIEEASKQNVPVSPFLKYLFEKRKDPELLQNFQDFLQANRLSSQARIVLRKNQ